jgi:hypothetical protein
MGRIGERAKRISPNIYRVNLSAAKSVESPVSVKSQLARTKFANRIKKALDFMRLT